MISTVVLEAFVGPCPKGYVAKHRNGDNTDNRLCNLEWARRKTPIMDISAEDKAGAFEAFGYDVDKRGGLAKHWPLKTIVRCFPSVKSTKQARQLQIDFWVQRKRIEENEGI